MQIKANHNSQSSGNILTLCTVRPIMCYPGQTKMAGRKQSALIECLANQEFKQFGFVFFLTLWLHTNKL